MQDNLEKLLGTIGFKVRDSGDLGTMGSSWKIVDKKAVPGFSDLYSYSFQRIMKDSDKNLLIVSDKS